MSHEEQQSLLTEIKKYIIGGAFTISIGLFSGAIIVRDSVIRHEVRITTLEKTVDRHETLLTQKNK